METTPTFRQWLKQRRQELDLTQDAVASATGCSPDTIRKIEAGSRRPSRQIAELLADFLQVDSLQHEAFVLWARGTSDAAPPAISPGPPVPTAQEVPVNTPGAPNSRPVPAITPRAVVQHGSNLPSLPTTLIGRERELAQMKALLWNSATRLLTLVGSPGIGKTSLSIALASSVQDDFKDGVLYVPLAPVSDPALVAAALAEGLGVPQATGRTLLDGLQDGLRDKQMLLVLDNFEHVVSSAPLLTDLLAVAPQVKMVVTSRSPLHLRGEKLVEVLPLDVPELEHLPPMEELLQAGSVALFEDRIRDFNSEFAITQENASIVAAICARLEGLPLAIELAAARTRLLSLPSLLSRLERQLTVLTGGPRDAPAHHRTLRDSLESSYSLLGEDARSVFRRLGIFAGPFTFEAAEQVAGATLETLEAVLDQSLVHVQRRPWTNLAAQNIEVGTYYSTLMPVREYALEQLEATGERDAIALKHAHYFLELTLQAEPEMLGPDPKLWLDRIGAVYNDIRVVLDWTLKNGQADIALPMAAGLRHFWRSKSYHEEGWVWLQKALEQSDNLPADLRVNGLNALGQFAFRRGDFIFARKLLLEAITLSRTLPDKLLIVNPAITMGQILTHLAEFDQAWEILQEALSVIKESGDRSLGSIVLGTMARVASFQGDLAQAVVLQEQALAIAKELGVASQIANTLQNLGALAMKQGDYHRAIVYIEEGAAMTAAIGDAGSLVYAWGVIGKAALGLGDYERAAANFSKCLSAFVEQGATRMIAFVLEEIARVAIGLGQLSKATRLFGVAEAQRESVGAPVDPPDRPERDRTIDSLRESLSEAEFTAAWMVGRSMPLEEAVAYATSSG